MPCLGGGHDAAQILHADLLMNTNLQPGPEMERRILDFARSELFIRTFTEGMGLVEETASYLDGPGRAASKKLGRDAALTYAAESMRLTTRLMQLASWLLVQRALREGDLPVSDALQEKYRMGARARREPSLRTIDDTLPDALLALMQRANSLFERVGRLDDQIYGEEAPGAQQPEASVQAQLSRLKQAFESE